MKSGINIKDKSKIETLKIKEMTNKERTCTEFVGKLCPLHKFHNFCVVGAWV